MFYFALPCRDGHSLPDVFTPDVPPPDITPARTLPSWFSSA